jgi:hypothetical protein
MESRNDLCKRERDQYNWLLGGSADTEQHKSVDSKTGRNGNTLLHITKQYIVCCHINRVNFLHIGKQRSVERIFSDR